MIEGLRVAPGFYDALRSGDIVSHLSNCDTCQAEHSAASREGIGCGWLPLVDGAQPMTPEGLPAEVALTTCPGYTTRLPQVIEAGEARMHADKHTLRAWLDDEDPTALMLTALRITEAAHCALLARPRKERS